MGVDDIEARYEKAQQEIAEASAALAQMRFTGQSDDERVTAAVNSAGHLVGLDIDPRVFRQPDSQGLAESVLTASERAREEAALQTTERLQSVLGPTVTADVLATGGNAEMFRAIGAHLESKLEGEDHGR